MAADYGLFDEKKLLEHYKFLVKRDYDQDLSNDDLKKYKSKRKSIMTNFEIPNTYMYFGTLCNILKVAKSLFEGHTNLEHINFLLPSKIEEIEEKAFKDCRSLKDIEIPENVKIIGDYAFKDCKNLKEIIFPEILETIGDSAFEGCESLDNVVVPPTVRRIGFNAFKGVNFLRYDGTAEGAPWGAKNFTSIDIERAKERAEEEA